MCLCNNSGWVVAYKKDSGQSYGFRCPCGRRAISPAIPTWSDAFNARFSLEPITLEKLPQKLAPPAPVKNEREVLTEEKTVQKDYQVLRADPHAYDDEDFPS